MPSAYILAKDQIEQARAMLANEVWFDPQLDHLFEVALFRLDELQDVVDAPVPLHPRSAVMPNAARGPRTRLMPWLDP